MATLERSGKSAEYAMYLEFEELVFDGTDTKDFCFRYQTLLKQLEDTELAISKAQALFRFLAQISPWFPEFEAAKRQVLNSMTGTIKDNRDVTLENCIAELLDDTQPPAPESEYLDYVAYSPSLDEPNEAALSNEKTQSPNLHQDSATEPRQPRLLDKFEFVPGKFSYERLPAGMIRKLDILPAAHPDGPLQTRLSSDVPGNRDYIALSYAWGATFEDGSHLTHSISCNGYPFPITRNLHAALLTIRRNLEKGAWHRPSAQWPAIWVDAICINQSSVQEKSELVQRMDQVYREAQRVVIFIGEVDRTDDVLLRGLSYASDLLLAVSQGKPIHTGVLTRNIYWPTLVNAVLQWPWYARRWVIQEFALNAQRTILLGDIVADWKDFVALFSILASRIQQLDQPQRRKHSLKLPLVPMTNAPVFDSSRPRRWLVTNIFLFRDAICSDERDKVYALLSISCNCVFAQACSLHGGSRCTSGVEVDYSLPLDAIISRLSPTWLRQDPMAVLLLASTQNYPESIDSRRPDRAEAGTSTGYRRRCPSWTPCAGDMIFKEPESVTWRNYESIFEPGDPDSSRDHGFTMLEDFQHWSINQRFPARQDQEESVCFQQARLPDALAISNCVFGFKDGRWRQEPAMPIQISSKNSRTLIASGWILLQPPNQNTLPREVDWSLLPRPDPTNPFMRWHSAPPCWCQQNDSPYEVVRQDDQGRLLPGQILFLLFGYKVVLVLQRTQESNRYVFVKLMRRAGPIRNSRFVWTVKRKDGVQHAWVYGSIETPPVEIEII